MSGLFGKKTEGERKLLAEIESTEFKKQSLISPLHNEILMAQQRIDQLLHKIGYEVYEGHSKGSLEQVNVKTQFAAIDDQKAFIKEKEAKIAEFAGRYDEEISMLQANLNQMMMAYAPQPMQYQTAAGGAGNAFCGGCGTRYTVGLETFCGGCGNKL